MEGWRGKGVRFNLSPTAFAHEGVEEGECLGLSQHAPTLRMEWWRGKELRCNLTLSLPLAHGGVEVGRELGLT